MDYGTVPEDLNVRFGGHLFRIDVLSGSASQVSGSLWRRPSSLFVLPSLQVVHTSSAGPRSSFSSLFGLTTHYAEPPPHLTWTWRKLSTAPPSAGRLAAPLVHTGFLSVFSELGVFMIVNNKGKLVAPLGSCCFFFLSAIFGC